MLQKFIDWLIDIFSKRGSRIIKIILFLLILLPVVLAGYFDYTHTEEHLTELVLSKRESLAHLAAIVLKEKFDHLTDINLSLATSVQFRELIKKRRWDEAVERLREVPQDFPFIERIFLSDPAGTLMADTPSLPDIKGKNFAFRDWYQGVLNSQEPYVSEIYKRTAKPQYNVLAVAGPIRDEEQNMLGILVLQLRLDDFFGWGREIDVGPAGFVYFADRNGHIAGHPKFPSEGEIIDFSSVPFVQKALKGEKGLEIGNNSPGEEEFITAFEQVPDYGWAVIVQQPTIIAFASKKADLLNHLLIYFFSLFIIILITFLILRFVNSLNLYRQKEKALLENIGDGLAAIDRSWNIILWNKAASSLTGWTEKEALGRPLRQVLKLVDERDRKENIGFIEEAMLFGRVVIMADRTLLLKKDKSEIFVADSASPIFDQNGVVSGAIIIFRDASKEKQVEKMQGEFASLATHQLRTPLVALKGYTEMLLEKVRDKRDKDMLEKIYQASQNMTDLVNALLNVSRIELGALAVNPEPLYLPDIADKVLQELLPEAEKKSLNIEKNYTAGIPAVSLDPKLTQAIFRNLLSNAIKYTPKKGRISVSIAKEANNLLIKISDNGCGIPKDQQAKIFSKFFQGSNIPKDEVKGSGLGLYLVKSILREADGRIWFESEENKGTTFYVSLPLSGMKKQEGTKGLQ